MGENAQKARTERLKPFRFKPGNQIAKGKGRPRKTEERRKFEEWAKEVSEDPDFQAMLRRRAMAGNTGIIRLILTYGVGKPKESDEESGLVGVRIVEDAQWGRDDIRSLPDAELERGIRELEGKAGLLHQQRPLTK